MKKQTYEPPRIIAGNALPAITHLCSYASSHTPQSTVAKTKKQATGEKTSAGG